MMTVGKLHTKQDICRVLIYRVDHKNGRLGANKKTFLIIAEI
jgi:hypothetical protein